MRTITGEPPRPRIEVRDATKSFRSRGLLPWRRRVTPVLEGVDLDVAPGEAVGIVGPNGAGKSTLLRVIAGLYEPDSGHVRRRGRVMALLDLVSGVEMRFTGRENLRWLAALHGIEPAAAAARLDGAIEFADLGDAVDRPAREYSSGMLLRLGFSLLTMIDADVLVLDEILAVGDLSFQRRCLRLLESCLERGMSLVLTSHDITFLARIAGRIVWMDQGRIRADGDAGDVVGAYLEDSAGRTGRVTADSTARIVGVDLLDRDRRPGSLFTSSGPMLLRIRYALKRDIERPNVGFVIYRQDWTCVIGTNSRIEGTSPASLPAGTGAVEILLDPLQLNPGWYFMSAAICEDDADPLHLVPVAVVFEVSGRGERRGLYTAQIDWNFDPGGDRLPASSPPTRTAP